MREEGDVRKITLLDFFVLFCKRTFIEYITEVEAIPRRNGLREQVMEVKEEPLQVGSEEANGSVRGRGEEEGKGKAICVCSQDGETLSVFLFLFKQSWLREISSKYTKRIIIRAN